MCVCVYNCVTSTLLLGVEKFITNMNEHQVVVTGRIDPMKVLEKLKKKTGKKVEIVSKMGMFNKPSGYVQGYFAPLMTFQLMEI